MTYVMQALSFCPRQNIALAIFGLQSLPTASRMLPGNVPVIRCRKLVPRQGSHRIPRRTRAHREHHRGRSDDLWLYSFIAQLRWLTYLPNG